MITSVPSLFRVGCFEYFLSPAVKNTEAVIVHTQHHGQEHVIQAVIVRCKSVGDVFGMYAYCYAGAVTASIAVGYNHAILCFAQRGSNRVGTIGAIEAFGRKPVI